MFAALPRPSPDQIKPSTPDAKVHVRVGPCCGIHRSHAADARRERRNDKGFRPTRTEPRELAARLTAK